jgi:hypothetical protein
VEAAPSDQISTLKGKTWIARLRTGPVAIFQASGSRAFRAAVSIAAAAADSAAVIALGAEATSAAVVDLAASAAAAAGSEAGAEN